MSQMENDIIDRTEEPMSLLYFLNMLGKDVTNLVVLNGDNGIIKWKITGAKTRAPLIWFTSHRFQLAV